MVMWWQIVVTVVCIIFSGTFSGLTLGLMSLDIIDLRVLTESGTENEKWYAHRILPVRKHGNWLLCTLLIGNTAVNAALAIVTADLFGGIPGFLSSTIAILYLGEIIPQAVCHRFGLVIGAYAIPLVRVLMFLTAPLSFTTAKALDFFLGGESVTRYNKSQLKSLLSIHGTVHHDPGSPSPDQSHDFGSQINAVVATSERGDVTIVHVQDDSPHPDHPSEAHPSSNTPSTSAAGQHVNVTVEDIPESSPVSRSPDSERARSRGSRVARMFEIKRSRFADKTARKDREKREKEKESSTSNPPLTKDEVTMLGGAFDFSQKTVGQVMTALDDVFMLEASLSLNFEVLLIIFQSGHSRVPVYDKTRDNIIGVLFTKDLILLDPEDSVPIKTVLLFFKRTVLLVFYDTTLNKMLNIFRQGGGHMAVVQQKKDDDEESLATLGVVTLEDLIEELIGQDIVDETDVYTDNINKQRVKRVRSIDPEVLKMFDSKHDEELLSEKEVLVVSSYLSNNTEEFSESRVDTNILRRMLAEIPIAEYKAHNGHRTHSGSPQNIAALAGTAITSDADGTSSDSGSGRDVDADSLQAVFRRSLDEEGSGREVEDGAERSVVTIYTRGVPTKNAYLIINGRVEISAGSDGFISEAGPWTLLGVHALTNDIYAPDFTARVIERPSRLLRIPRRLYQLMVQYSAARPRTVVVNGSRGKRSSSSPPSNATSSSRRRFPPRPSTSFQSLAVAAAAAAAAVGGPSTRIGDFALLGTANEPQVVRKTRSRPNGQSIEWSELEPSQVQIVETRVRGSVQSSDHGTGEPSQKATSSAENILEPQTGLRHDEQASNVQESGQDKIEAGRIS